MPSRRSMLMFCVAGLVLAVAGQALASYQMEVLADNPHGYWRLGETSGLVALDASPGGPNGSYGQFSPPDGLPTLGVRGITANYTDTGVEFNGTSPVSQIYVADSLDPTAYALEAWVKVDVGATMTRGIINRTASNPLTTFSHSLGINSAGQFEHYTYDGAGRSVVAPNPVIPDEWYHIVGLYNPGPAGTGFMALYVNGDQAAYSSAGTLNSPWTGGNQWRFAAPSGRFNGWFDGVMDEVAIYDHLLTPDRILAHYNAGIVPEPTTLLIWSLLAGLGVGLGWRRRK